VPGQTFVYVRRPGYWDAKDFPYDKIVITFFSSTTAEDNAAKSGQIQLAFALSAKDTASGLSFVKSAPNGFMGFYITDVKGAVSKPLGKKGVRQAMNYAIDRKAIVKALVAPYGVVCGSTPFPKAYLGYSSALVNRYPYSPSTAKELLKASGYPHGFTVSALVDPMDVNLAQAIAGYERKVGIKLKISVHSTDFITQMFTGKWPLVSGDYTLNPAEYQTLKGIAGRNGFWNPRHNTNSKVAKLFAQILAAANDTAAKPLYEKLATTLADLAWYVNPVIEDPINGYNSSTVTVVAAPGLPYPMVYGVTPKG
jgi:peptide/nickel transport system substrate-binding protein